MSIPDYEKLRERQRFVRERAWELHQREVEKLGLPKKRRKKKRSRGEKLRRAEVKLSAMVESYGLELRGRVPTHRVPQSGLPRRRWFQEVPPTEWFRHRKLVDPWIRYHSEIHCPSRHDLGRSEVVIMQRVARGGLARLCARREKHAKLCVAALRRRERRRSKAAATVQAFVRGVLVRRRLQRRARRDMMAARALARELDRHARIKETAAARRIQRCVRARLAAGAARKIQTWVRNVLARRYAVPYVAHFGNYRDCPCCRRRPGKFARIFGRYSHLRRTPPPHVATRFETLRRLRHQLLDFEGDTVVDDDGRGLRHHDDPALVRLVSAQVRHLLDLLSRGAADESDPL